MHLGKNHFLGQHEHENIKLLLRRHIVVLVINLLPALFLAAIIYLGYRFLPQNFSIIAESPYYEYFLLVINILTLYDLGFMFLVWMDWYLDVWILTEERIVDIEQMGLFGRNVAEFKLDRIQDVTVHSKGILETVFNYGDVRIQTAGEKEEFIFEQVPSPYAAKDIILKAAQETKPV